MSPLLPGGQTWPSSVKHRLPGSHAIPNRYLWRPLVALTGAAAPEGGGMEWRAGHRCLQEASNSAEGAVQPQAVSRTNLLKTGSKEEKGGARILTHFPSLLTGPPSFVS